MKLPSPVLCAPGGGGPLRVRLRAGFSLVELMVGLGIVLVAMLAVVSSMNALNANASHNRTVTAARAIAESNVREFLATPYALEDGVARASNRDLIRPGTRTQTVTLAGTGAATGTQTLSRLFGANREMAIITGTHTSLTEAVAGSVGMVRITSRVAWTERGRNYTIELVGIRAPDSI